MFYAFLTMLVGVLVAAIAAGFAFGCRMPDGSD